MSQYLKMVTSDTEYNVPIRETLLEKYNMLLENINNRIPKILEGYKGYPRITFLSGNYSGTAIPDDDQYSNIAISDDMYFTKPNVASAGRTITMRDIKGNLWTGDPIDAQDCINKDYFDKHSGTTITIDQTYSSTSENAQSGKAVAQAIAEAVLPGGTVDQTYDSTSANAQSGKAVAEAVKTKVPMADWQGSNVYNKVLAIANGHSPYAESPDIPWIKSDYTYIEVDNNSFSEAGAGNIPIRNESGNLCNIGTITKNEECTTKAYVDSMCGVVEYKEVPVEGLTTTTGAATTLRWYYTKKPSSWSNNSINYVECWGKLSIENITPDQSVTGSTSDKYAIIDNITLPFEFDEYAVVTISQSLTEGLYTSVSAKLSENNVSQGYYGAIKALIYENGTNPVSGNLYFCISGEIKLN